MTTRILSLLLLLTVTVQAQLILPPTSTTFTRDLLKSKTAAEAREKLGLEATRSALSTGNTYVTNFYFYSTNFYAGNTYVSNSFTTNYLSDTYVSNFFSTNFFGPYTYTTNLNVTNLWFNSYVSNYFATNIFNDVYNSNYFSTNLYQTVQNVTTNTYTTIYAETNLFNVARGGALVVTNLYFLNSRPQTVAWAGPTNKIDFSLGQSFTYTAVTPFSITNIIGITNGYMNSALLTVTNGATTNITFTPPTGWKIGPSDSLTCTNGDVLQIWPSEQNGIKVIATKSYH